MTTPLDQHEYDIRCEWGLQGVLHLAPISDVIIIVDVLSFSTCVSIACSRGVLVFPYGVKGETAEDFAHSINAVAASQRGQDGFSLSPASLTRIPAGTRLVLPSPNGATLSLSTGNTPTLTGCLRNPAAVAQAALKIGQRIGVIAAGERWQTDGSLRPAIEDLVGAGAIIRFLKGSLSPEAQVARAAFESQQTDLPGVLKSCASGKELLEKGYEKDVDLSAALEVDDCVPLLVDGAYLNAVDQTPNQYESDLESKPLTDSFANKILLREVVEEDLHIFYQQQLDPQATSMAGFPAREQAALMVHWQKIMADPSNVLMTIIYNGQVAGNIVSFVQGGMRQIGYWIGKPFWGKGIATQALSAFLDQVSERPLNAFVAKNNNRSIRVLEKCGFIQHGEEGEEWLYILGD
jgi:2-phosphosulfolactate phosphatase